MKPRQRTGLTLGLVLAGVVLAFAFAWWPKPRDVQLAEVRLMPLKVERVDQGYARVRDVYVVTTPVAGTMARIELEPGDAVVAGEVLATLAPLASSPLDPRSSAMADAAVDTARAQVRQAEAAAGLARDMRERSDRLFADRLIPERELTSVRAGEREAEARLSAARANLRQAEVNASWETRAGSRALELTSPITGVVLRRWHESAGAVAVGTALLELGDPRDLEVVAEFLSQEAAGIEVGADATIEAWGGAPLSAVVSRVEPLGELKISALGVEERRVRVILQLKEPAPKLGHGYQVDARVTVLNRDSVVAVPLETLQRIGDGWRVWVAEAGRVSPVTVTVGAHDDRIREIIAGLSAGQSVVVSPPADLVAGTSISAVP